LPFSDALASHEEDAMSVTLVTTTVLEHLGLKARTPQPESLPEPPKPETPRQKRDRLRQEVLARGGTLEQIETITGDCEAQTAKQIADLSGWLAQH
jgi:hypothetical protein